MKIGEKSMIERVWEACEGPWKRVVLTSRDPSDDRLAEYLFERRIDYRRGTLERVLYRYMQLLEEMHPKVLVRVCGDAPFMRAEYIQKAVEATLLHGAIFVPELLHAGTPEAWRKAALHAGREDYEHAGSQWFEKNAKHLALAPSAYLMVNTQADLEEARRRWAKTPVQPGA